MAAPREEHLAQLKRLVRYLKGRPRCVIQYERQDARSARLRVHTDSDWAGEAVTRRSTSGMVIRRGSHLIRHSSTLQTSIGLSSAEAEYFGAMMATRELIWLRDLLVDLGVEFGGPSERDLFVCLV